MEKIKRGDKIRTHRIVCKTSAVVFVFARGETGLLMLATRMLKDKPCYRMIGLKILVNIGKSHTRGLRNCNQEAVLCHIIVIFSGFGSSCLFETRIWFLGIHRAFFHHL
ncbi:hypothetical protein LSTR_LSTR001845, partial [Laodelphax striatellus]